MADAFLTGWSFRKKITVQHANLDGNQSDFPLYVPIKADADIAKALAAGADLRFSLADGTTLLKYEIEAWAGGGGGGAVTADNWVKVPSLLAAGGSYIYSYYGKAGAADGQDAANVWDGDFLSAHHLGEAASPYLDSTGNNVDSSGGTDPAQTAGKVANGQEFDAADVITFGNGTLAALLDGAPACTISLWFNADTMPGDDLTYIPQIGFVGGNNTGFSLQIQDVGGTDFLRGAGRSRFADANQTHDVAFNTTGAWTHAVAIMDYANDQIRLHVNGGAADTGGVTFGAATFTDADDQTSADAISFAAAPFDGALDEVRVSKIARSAAWTKFEHANIDTPDNELTWGPEERAASPFFYNRYVKSRRVA